MYSKGKGMGSTFDSKALKGGTVAWGYTGKPSAMSYSYADQQKQSGKAGTVFKKK